MSSIIYLDYHSTTPMLPEAWEAMRPFACETFGNPSSTHRRGRQARQALEQARDRIAALLDCFPDEVIFTSGATESNNLAIHGLLGDAPGQLITSDLEHPCVIEPIKELAKHGFDLKLLQPDSFGMISPVCLQEQLTDSTRLVAIQLVNHEVGTIQPIPRLAYVAEHLPNCYLHCDAAQAVGKLRVTFRGLNVHTLALSAHKFGGPKGVGALLVRRCTPLHPLFQGGHQQRGKRPGTEAVGLIVGMAAALEISIANQANNLAKVKALRERFISGLRKTCSPMTVHGSETGSSYVANIAFQDCRAEGLLMKLDLLGICCSTGSACSSGSSLPSPILRAMQVPEDLLIASMRFSFSPSQSEEEIDEAVSRIANAVGKLRQEPDLGPLRM
jgi:cysteine desulfurase